MRRRLWLRIALDDKDAGGSQEPIVDRVTVLRYAYDRAGRLRGIIHLHHRLMQGRIEGLAERIDFLNAEAGKGVFE